MAHRVNGWKKGKYTVKNPEKYLGDVDNVIFRSSWEEEAFIHMDTNPNILKWASEELVIEYMKPSLEKGGYVRGYYSPDLYIAKKDRQGNIIHEVIEIKPYKQTVPPKSRNTKTRMREEYEWIINNHKWAAAQAWCKKHGVKFTIMTEKDMFS